VLLILRLEGRMANLGTDPGRDILAERAGCRYSPAARASFQDASDQIVFVQPLGRSA
jgi:hypothetical protein